MEIDEKDEIDELFTKATRHANQLYDVNENEMLKLYGLYKQANEGPCNLPKPKMWEFTAKVKWGTWNHLGDLSQLDAKKQYIELVRNLDPEWDTSKTEMAGLGASVSVLMKDPEDNINESDKDIFDFCREGQLEKIKSTLNEDKSLLHLSDDNQLTLLHWAADQGHVEIADYLIHCGCNINGQDSEQQTPLHYAVTCGHLELTRFLLKTGSDHSIKDVDGNIPAFYCDDDEMKNIFNNL